MSELGQSPRVYTWQVYHRSAVPYLRHILCLVAVDLPVSLTMPVVTLEKFEHLVPEDYPAQEMSTWALKALRECLALPISSTVVEKCEVRMWKDCLGGVCFVRYVAPKKAPGLGAGTYSAILLVADEFGRVVYRGIKGSALEILCKAAVLDVTCSSYDGIEGCKDAQAEVLRNKPFGIDAKVAKEPTAQEKELQQWACRKIAEDVELLCSSPAAGGLGLLAANVSLTGEFNGAPNGAPTPQRTIRACDGWDAFNGSLSGGSRPGGTPPGAGGAPSAPGRDP